MVESEPVKGTFTVNGHAFTMTYTYGDPKITTIYDVGVPRDAKVVDGRVKQAAQPGKPAGSREK